MNDDEKMNEWIELYNAGKLEEPDYSRFVHLMNTDPAVKVYVNMDKTINQMLEYGEMFDLLEKVQKARHSTEKPVNRFRVLMIAASLLVFLASGWALLFRKGGEHIKDRLSKVMALPSTAPPIGLGINLFKRVEPEKRITFSEYRRGMVDLMVMERFQPFAPYEVLVGGVMRSGRIKLLTPKIRTSVPYTTDITFSWETFGEWFPVMLEVTDNSGKPVMESCLVTGHSYTLNTRKFTPGRFYWKLLSESGLMVMGSFILY